MKKGCLSEEIFGVVSNEESHYKRRSFDRKARRISQDDKKHSILQKLYLSFINPHSTCLAVVLT